MSERSLVGKSWPAENGDIGWTFKAITDGGLDI
jgi:hypothetical protein